MARSKQRKVHRQFYPAAKKGQRSIEVKPLVKADQLITADGIKLDFLEPHKHLTPGELKMFARWLYALSHEAEEVARSGFVSESKSYDVDKEEVVSVAHPD